MKPLHSASTREKIQKAHIKLIIYQGVRGFPASLPCTCSTRRKRHNLSHSLNYPNHPTLVLVVPTLFLFCHLAMNFRNICKTMLSPVGTHSGRNFFSPTLLLVVPTLVLALLALPYCAEFPQYSQDKAVSCRDSQRK